MDISFHRALKKVKETFLGIPNTSLYLCGGVAPKSSAKFIDHFMELLSVISTDFRYIVITLRMVVNNLNSFTSCRTPDEHLTTTFFKNVFSYLKRNMLKTDKYLLLSGILPKSLETTVVKPCNTSIPISNLYTT